MPPLVSYLWSTTRILELYIVLDRLEHEDRGEIIFQPRKKRFPRESIASEAFKFFFFFFFFEVSGRPKWAILMGVFRIFRLKRPVSRLRAPASSSEEEQIMDGVSGALLYHPPPFFFKKKKEDGWGFLLR